MGHAPATIVILAWSEWERTRACLDALRPTLGPRDQVVVVDRGAAQGTADGLRRYRWAETVTALAGAGVAAARNAGAARARNAVVVFLDDDTQVPARWLDGLVAAFDDETVVAAGPRSNAVSGPQLVVDPWYDAERNADLQRFARTWREEHRGQVTQVRRLDGFCLAVRREALVQAGGFDEAFGDGSYGDADLCARLLGAGGRLLVAHASYVHHAGSCSADGAAEHLALYEAKHGAPPPAAGGLLAVHLIVKDEEVLLPECLASIKDVVDEIVVYDTGSADRTVEIAEAAGAVVRLGYWDDDFARARNAALDGTSCEWVLVLDADERFVGDGAELRAVLAAADAPGAPEQFTMRVDNVAPDGDGVSFSHVGVRVFRRNRGRWLGRLHEQVVPRRDQQSLRSTLLDGPSLLHVGYREDIVVARDKLNRNLRVAEAEVAAGAEHPSHAMLSLARALGAAGQLEEALERFVEARDASEHEPGVQRQAIRSGAQTLLDLGRPQEALSWIERLRAMAGSAGMASFLEGIAHLNMGDHAAALAALSGLDADVVDEDGYRVPASMLAVHRGIGLLGGQRWAEAADAFRELLADPEAKVPVWSPLVEATVLAGGDVRALAGLVQESQLTSVLGQLLNAHPVPAEAVADALWERTPGRPALLAFGARVAPAAGVERALEWSTRLRAAGIDNRCPLVALAGDETLPAIQRLQSAVVAAVSFGDVRGEELLSALAGTLPAEQLPDGIVQVATLAPEHLPGFIEAAAVGPHRCLVLAQSLHELGAPDEALAVLEHGFAQPGPRDTVVEAAAWLRQVGQDGRASELLAAS